MEWRVRPYPSTVGRMEARAGSGAHRDRDRGRPSEGRLKDESGSILVLFAIFASDLHHRARSSSTSATGGRTRRRRRSPPTRARSLRRASFRRTGDRRAAHRLTECQMRSEREYVARQPPDQAGPDKGAKHLSTRVLSPYKSEEQSGRSNGSHPSAHVLRQVSSASRTSTSSGGPSRSNKAGRGKWRSTPTPSTATPTSRFSSTARHAHRRLGALRARTQRQRCRGASAGLHGEQGHDGVPDPAHDPTKTRCEESINPSNHAADFVPASPDICPRASPRSAGLCGTRRLSSAATRPRGPARRNRCDYKGEKIIIENDEDQGVSDGSCG